MEQRRRGWTKETDLQQSRSKRGRNRSKNRREKPNQTACCVLVVLAGHRQRGKEEEKKLSQIHMFTGSACGGA